MDKNKIIVILAIVFCVALALYLSLMPKSVENNQDQINQSDNNKNMDLKIEVLKEGEGLPITDGQTAVVHYTGWLQNGTKFDSSVDRGEPFEFTLGSGYVIQGWEKGVLGMKVGEKRKLTIPPELGYGDKEIGGVIPANSVLIFEVELLEIK